MRPMFATDARLGFQKLIEPVCAMQHLGKSENEAVQNMAYFNKVGRQSYPLPD